MTTEPEPSARSSKLSSLWKGVTVALLAAAATTGGYAWGNSSQKPQASTEKPQPSPTVTVTLPAPEETQKAEPAVPVPEPASDAAPVSEGDSAQQYNYLTGYSFSQTGLDDDSSSAPVYGFDSSASFSAEKARAAAAVFQVAGDPVEQAGSWVVGSLDGTGPNVTLGGDYLSTLSFYNPSADPYSCPEAVNEGASCAPRQPASPISLEQAEEKAKELLTALGVELSDFTFEAENSEIGTIYVSAHPGTGKYNPGAWTFGFFGEDIVTTYGSLAPRVSLGEYEVISPLAAFERMNDKRFAAQIIQVDYLPVEPFSQPSPVPVPAAGSKIPWAVEEVLFTSASIDSRPYVTPEGVGYLLPYYSLTTDSGVSWQVPALSENALSFN